MYARLISSFIALAKSSNVIYRPAFVDINIGKGRLQGEGRSCARFVLNLGRTYTFDCRRESKAVRKQTQAAQQATLSHFFLTGRDAAQ
jgi:hypothetical protein